MVNLNHGEMIINVHTVVKISLEMFILKHVHIVIIGFQDVHL